MMQSAIPEFAVLGHPNEGKSSVVSTLAEDDSVKISPTPGETLSCRSFPVRIDGKEIIRFTDTPGFQRPRKTLKWMEAYAGPRKQLAADFCEAHKNNPDFRNECELFGPVVRGAGIIFVVDGSRPLRNNDRMEIEILRQTGRPRMAIINSKALHEEHLSEWKNEFRKNFNAVRVFNAHNANYRERIALLETLKAIDQDWQIVLEKVIRAFREDWKNRRLVAADLICDLLARCLSHRVEKAYAEAGGERETKSRVQTVYQKEIAALEKQTHDRIRQLYKHNIFELDLPPQSIVHEDLFSTRTWQVLGLKPVQLAAAAALGGGVIGAKLDIAAAGLGFGVFTAIGGAVAAGSAYLLGEKMVKAKVVGFNLGGYTVTVGPHKSPNFPFILMDRALIVYSHVINWAHGKRDYPDVDRDKKRHVKLKEGYTAAWSSDDKKICQTFFKAIRSGDPHQIESRRRRMADFLAEKIQTIA